MGNQHTLTRATLDMLFGSLFLQAYILFLTLIILEACQPTSLLGYGYLGINTFLYLLELMISILRMIQDNNGDMRRLEMPRISHRPLVFAVGMLSLVSSLTDYRPVLL
jgi:hypothetical protein